MQRIIIALVLAVVVVACAPTTKRVEVDQSAVDKEADHQKALALEGLINDQIRLYRVTFPLRVAGVEFCKGNTTYAIGMHVLNVHMLGGLKAAGKTQLIDEKLKVMTVPPGGPADRAGLRVGDYVLSLNEWDLPAGPDGVKTVNDRMLELMKTDAPLRVKVLRDNQWQTLTIVPELVCRYPAGLAPQDIINAFADGERVMITRGMMRFVTSDEELALVVSHEIAHNAMGHIDAQRGNRLAGAVLEGILSVLLRTQSTGMIANAAGAAFSQDFEAEADYVGLYIMARAGMKIDEAPKFWRRMAVANPSNIAGNHTASHPATSYRLVALEKTVVEIAQKRATGTPLRPEMKAK